MKVIEVVNCAYVVIKKRYTILLCNLKKNMSVNRSLSIYVAWILPKSNKIYTRSSIGFPLGSFGKTTTLFCPLFKEYTSYTEMHLIQFTSLMNDKNGSRCSQPIPLSPQRLVNKLFARRFCFLGLHSRNKIDPFLISSFFY